MGIILITKLIFQIKSVSEGNVFLKLVIVA